MTRRRAAILAGIGAAALALTLGAALVRSGDGGTADAAALADMTSYVAAASSSDDGGQTDLRSQIDDLMTDEDFRNDVRALRDEQQDAVDAWWDEYGEDRDSDAARAALEDLREAQRTEMNALLEKYGVDTTAGEQAREDARQAREKIGELMSDDAFRAGLSALRDTQQDAMGAWRDKYGEDPTSDAAREAMQTLRENAASDVEKLLEQYGIELPDGLGDRFFGGHGGGAMGPGGLMGGGLMGGDGFVPPADGSSPCEQESTTDLSL
jgi:hypothetical protein